MTEEQFDEIMSKLVEIESRIFALEHPGSISITFNSEQGGK